MTAKKASEPEKTEAVDEQQLDMNPVSIPTHSEAQVSANIYLYSEKGANIQLTVRSGATSDEVKRVLDNLVEGVKYGIEKYNLDVRKQTSGAVQSSGQPPKTGNIPTGQPPMKQGNAPGITSMTFQTTKLVGQWMSKGEGHKLYWKVVGEMPFHVHGIRIWDEVLEEAGFDLNGLSTQLEWPLEGYTAHYVDTPKQKVTQLVKNA